jgi:Sec-independent protein translocase protein TatA
VSFGLTIEKLLLIGVIALFLIGPDRLPGYSAQLGRLIRQLRTMASGAKDRMRDELGPDFDDMDWKKLDPRQYDPRRIIREALQEAPTPATPTALMRCRRGCCRHVGSTPMRPGPPARRPCLPGHGANWPRCCPNWAKRRHAWTRCA